MWPKFALQPGPSLRVSTSSIDAAEGKGKHAAQRHYVAVESSGQHCRAEAVKRSAAGTPAGRYGHEGWVVAETESEALALEGVTLEDLARGILAEFAEPKLGVLDTSNARAEEFGGEGDVIHGLLGMAGIADGHCQASLSS